MSTPDTDDLIVGEWGGGFRDPIVDLARIEAGMCPAGHKARRVGDWMECELSYGAVFQLRRDADGSPRIVYTSFLPKPVWYAASKAHNDRKRRGEIPADDYISGRLDERAGGDGDR